MYSRFTPFGYAVRGFLFKAFGLVLGITALSGLVYAFNQSSAGRPTPDSPPVMPVPFVTQATPASVQSNVQAAPQKLFFPEVHGVDVPTPQPETIPAVASNPLPDRYSYEERYRQSPPPRPHYSYTRDRDTYGLKTGTVETHTLPTHTYSTGSRETSTPRPSDDPRPSPKTKRPNDDRPKSTPRNQPSRREREKARDKKRDSSR